MEFTNNLTPIQTELGEMIFWPNFMITDVHARRSHAQMEKSGDEDMVTDTPSEGAYILSDYGGIKISRADAKDMTVGIKIHPYSENKKGKEPELFTLEDLFRKKEKKVTPADLGKRIKNKYRISENKEDLFDITTDAQNLESRAPFINALIGLGEIERETKELEDRYPEIDLVPLFKKGGIVKAQDIEKMFLGGLFKGIGKAVGGIGKGIFEGAKGIGDFGLSSIGLPGIIDNSFVDKSGFLSDLTNITGSIAPLAANFIPGAGPLIGKGLSLLQGSGIGGGPNAGDYFMGQRLGSQQGQQFAGLQQGLGSLAGLFGGQGGFGNIGIAGGINPLGNQQMFGNQRGFGLNSPFGGGQGVGGLGSILGLLGGGQQGLGGLGSLLSLLANNAGGQRQNGGSASIRGVDKAQAGAIVAGLSNLFSGGQFNGGPGGFQDVGVGSNVLDAVGGFSTPGGLSVQGALDGLGGLLGIGSGGGQQGSFQTTNQAPGILQFLRDVVSGPLALGAGTAGIVDNIITGNNLSGIVNDQRAALPEFIQGQKNALGLSTALGAGLNLLQNAPPEIQAADTTSNQIEALERARIEAQNNQRSALDQARGDIKFLPENRQGLALADILRANNQGGGLSNFDIQIGQLLDQQSGANIGTLNQNNLNRANFANQQIQGLSGIAQLPVSLAGLDDRQFTEDFNLALQAPILRNQFFQTAAGQGIDLAALLNTLGFQPATNFTG